MSTPDPNAKAPRPSGKAEASSKPSMDSPPRRQSAERATQAEGTADTPSVERSKHMPPASR